MLAMDLQMLLLTENMFPYSEDRFFIDRNQTIAAWSHSPTHCPQIIIMAAPFRTVIAGFQRPRELQKYFLCLEK